MAAQVTERTIFEIAVVQVILPLLHICLVFFVTIGEPERDRER